MHNERALRGLGVDENQIFADHGLAGTDHSVPGFREVAAAARAGDIYCH
ncbi:hypothetical protein J2S92_004299 [Arthrobacter bambusae]|nr:hypothetical protein [Arthrobacter bambusae]MDQ0237925.1 hypothetical protein [Arthrobacter bambusae]